MEEVCLELEDGLVHNNNNNNHCDNNNTDAGYAMMPNSPFKQGYQLTSTMEHDVQPSTPTTSTHSDDRVYQNSSEEPPRASVWKGRFFTFAFVSLMSINYLTAWNSASSLGSKVALFLVHSLSLLVIYCHANCVIRSPGFVEKNWVSNPHLSLPLSLPLCKYCKSLKPFRAHHCRQCNKCVLRMVSISSRFCIQFSKRFRIIIVFGSIIAWGITITNSSF
jgi:hypothetical protein